MPFAETARELKRPHFDNDRELYRLTRGDVLLCYLPQHVAARRLFELLVADVEFGYIGVCGANSPSCLFVARRVSNRTTIVSVYRQLALSN